MARKNVAAYAPGPSLTGKCVLALLLPFATLRGGNRPICHSQRRKPATRGKSVGVP